MYLLLFFFNDPATTEIYTLSLHDALPISAKGQLCPSSVFSVRPLAFHFARLDAHSASRRSVSPALSSRQLSAQVDNLPHVMIRMPRAPHKNLEAVFRFRLALRGVLFPPASFTLLSNRRHHHGHDSKAR